MDLPDPLNGAMLRLRIGEAGQLYLAGDLVDVLPAEETGALKAANSIREDGTLQHDRQVRPAR